MTPKIGFEMTPNKVNVSHFFVGGFRRALIVPAKIAPEKKALFFLYPLPKDCSCPPSS